MLVSDFAKLYLDKISNSVEVLPKLRGDIQYSMKKLLADPVKVTDPFESIYRVVYHLTMRMVGVNDIADDPVLLEETLQLFTAIDESAAATTVLFPSFPSLKRLKQTFAGGKLYLIFRKIVEQRKKSGKRSDDALQYLIDEGDDMRQITEVCFKFSRNLAMLIHLVYRWGTLCRPPKQWHQRSLDPCLSGSRPPLALKSPRGNRRCSRKI